MDDTKFFSFEILTEFIREEEQYMKWTKMIKLCERPLAGKFWPVIQTNCYLFSS